MGLAILFTIAAVDAHALYYQLAMLGIDLPWVYRSFEGYLPNWIAGIAAAFACAFKPWPSKLILMFKAAAIAFPFTVLSIAVDKGLSFNFPPATQDLPAAAAFGLVMVAKVLCTTLIGVFIGFTIEAAFARSPRGRERVSRHFPEATSMAEVRADAMVFRQDRTSRGEIENAE